MPKHLIKKRDDSSLRCNWFTNLDIKKRDEELILYKKYNEKTTPNMIIMMLLTLIKLQKYH